MIQGGGTETDIGFSPQNSIGVGHTHKHTNKHTHRSTYRGGAHLKKKTITHFCLLVHETYYYFKTVSQHEDFLLPVPNCNSYSMNLAKGGECIHKILNN